MSEILLATLLALSNLFWAFVCLRFANRLMARDFGDYVRNARKPEKPKPIVLEVDEFAENQAQEINSIMGLA